MAASPPTTRRKWRIALLLTTVLMGLALCFTGFHGYLQAKRHSVILAKSEVVGMLHGLRRELARTRGRPGEAVDAFMLDAKEQGLHYIAFVDGKGDVRAEFGELKIPLKGDFLNSALRAPLRPGGMGRGGPLPPPQLQTFDEGIVHAVLPFPRRMRPPWALTNDIAPRLVVIEVQSLDGPQIVASAIVSLSIAFGAALLLLIAAVLFWRLSVRQELETQKIAQERLEMVEELEKDKRLKALGQMSAVLGHQLKNPIAALKGHSQLLLERLEPHHKGRRQAETVLKETLLLETLTKQILEYARTGELRYSKVYLDDLASGAVAQSGVPNVTISVPEEETTWRLDRSRIEQVIINLLSNAQETTDTEKEVELALRVIDAELEISVRDHGGGISPGDEYRVFDPFYTQKAEGTGLGLALAKRIVEGHGGTISARNHDHGGAVLTIRLPNRPSALQAGEKNGKRSSSG